MILGLANDDWWEVQAQLLELASQLLVRVATGELSWENTEDVGAATAGTAGRSDAEVVDQLTQTVNRIFHENGSKNVLQVGLSSLVHCLQYHPSLLPMYVSVLTRQPPIFRQRLLEPTREGEARLVKNTYVLGSSARMYEEQCIA